MEAALKLAIRPRLTTQLLSLLFLSPSTGVTDVFPTPPLHFNLLSLKLESGPARFLAFFCISFSIKEFFYFLKSKKAQSF